MTQMTKTIALATVAGCLFASGASAGPLLLSESEMDSVVAGATHRVSGFVCPVITTDGVLNSPKGAAIGEGHYTIIGPDVAVPVHATNDNGAGTPGGDHLQPGEVGYTAIWATQ